MATGCVDCSLSMDPIRKLLKKLKRILKGLDIILII